MRAKPIQFRTLPEMAIEVEKIAIAALEIQDAAMKLALRAGELAARVKPYADIQREKERQGKK